MHSVSAAVRGHSDVWPVVVQKPRLCWLRVVHGIRLVWQVCNLMIRDRLHGDKHQQAVHVTPIQSTALAAIGAYRLLLAIAVCDQKSGPQIGHQVNKQSVLHSLSSACDHIMG